MCCCFDTIVSSDSSAVVQKKEIRKCVFGSRVSSLIYDFYFVCIACHGYECNFDKRCGKYKDVFNYVIEAYVKSESL